MTMRYFYTDPLAAAWMAHHFGMLIALRILPHSPWHEAGDDLSGCIDMPADDVATLIRQLLDKRGSDYEPGRYYVHPDSLRLLEPRKGDAVEFDRWFFERRRDPQYAGYPYQAHYGRVAPFGSGDQHLGITSAGVCWDNTSDDAGFSLPFKIIQRDGVAFMWPESEGA